MAYKKLVLYFTVIGQMSASLTRLCPSNSFRSSYQRCRIHKFQIIVTFFLLIKKIINNNYLYIGIEKEYRKKQINELV